MIEQDFRDKLLDVLLEFHNFCEEHNLKYYLIGGSLIGAVRHGGFIPWDDDIDVAMPRKDYERFLRLKHEIKDDFKVSVPFQKDGYINTMSRIYSTKLKIEEEFIKRYTIGPWVDIFPLDNTFDNIYLRKIHFKLVYIFKVLNTCKLGGISVQKGRKKATLKLFVYYLMKLVPSLFLSKSFEYLQTMKKNPTHFVANLTGRWKDKEIIELKELEKQTKVKFENISLYTFENYPLWLHSVYGDYMKLPPKQQQVPDHFYRRIYD